MGTRGAWPVAGAAVAAGAALSGLLAIPIRHPRIYGDELIYWQLGRSLAWTGEFAVRGGATPRYGVVYPLLVSIAQRLGGDQVTAFAIAQALNAVVFSLTAVPVYFIALRVLRPRLALLAALLTVIVPSCVLTSAIMTENAFYPLFALSALLMLRALERPSVGRQLLVAASVGAAFLARAQGVVLLPSYLLAALILAVVSSPGRRRVALVEAVRRHVPTIAILALGGVGAVFVRGSSTLGPYHVLVTSYDVRPLVHWALANLADIDIYLGVVPLAAFALLLVRALSGASLSPDLRRLVVLTACLGLGLLATVAALSASPYGLGRTHERNLFFVAPLVLVAFLAWLEIGMPRPRVTASVVALVLVALPLAIPLSALSSSGEDGLALVFVEDRGNPARHAIAELVLAAAVAAAVFLLARWRVAMVAVMLVAFGVALESGEVHAVRAVRSGRAIWSDRGWIDRAVGADARVVALWGTAAPQRDYARVERLWADEFFNRSVRDVASAMGRLPDGLPVERLGIRPGGCLDPRFPFVPQYAVADASTPLAAPVVGASPSGQRILYQLGERKSARLCLVRLRHR